MRLLPALLFASLGATIASSLVNTTAMAQIDVTVREANAVPQANIDALIALGGAATQQDVDDNIVYEMEGEFIQFTAVLLSDPFNSGLSSWNTDTNQPNRVHVFVRDTNAVLMGYEGMTTQLVDGSAAVVDMEVGDVYIIQAVVSSFNGNIQINPTAFENQGSYGSLGLPDEIMDPIMVTTDDLNSVIGSPFGGTVVQINWANFNDMNSQYVRMEDALVTVNVIGDRYYYQYSSSGTDALANSDDMSLRFRNDRSGDPDYPNPPWNSHPGDIFSPPAIGAAISVQGFALYRGYDFTNNSSTPLGVLMVVSPWEDEDLELYVPPPPISITCTPRNPPIVIPASGGFYQYDLEIVNNSTSTEVFQIWLDVTGPGGGIQRGPVFRSLAPGNTLFRTLAQRVPSSAPPGTYTQTCSIGTYPTSDFSSSFDWEKSASFGLGGVSVADWTTEAEFAEALAGLDAASLASEQTPTEFTLERAYPNPFNPATTIRFSLPEAAYVRLVVYDVLGRQISVLVDGTQEAGTHEVIFDGSDLPSGTYLYRLETPQGSFVRTMLLAK